MTHAVPRRRTVLAAALAVVAALASLASTTREDAAQAAPDAAVTYVAATGDALQLWRTVDGELQVTVYELGYADPGVGTGWRPVRDGVLDAAGDDALRGPFLFRVDAARSSGVPIAGRVVAVSGVVWEEASSRFLSGSPDGSLTEWRVADGEVVEARLHHCLRIPPGFETLDRQGPSGAIERRTIMGPPPRTASAVTRFLPAPEGRLRASGPAAEDAPQPGTR